MLIFAFVPLLAIPMGIVYAENPNLYVSAENPYFENHFAGSMVVEVIVRNSDIRDTSESMGEPDVTINGNSLRMVQTTDGNWYAYFTHIDAAKAADSTVMRAGEGLDFGVFCGNNTSASIFGISLSESKGFAVPSSSGLEGFSNGNEKFSECSGTPSGLGHNNIVRNPKQINTNSGILPGQIGLDPDAWPLVQLFSFSDVVIRYNPGTGVQKVELKYGEIPNISVHTDRNSYPQNSHVFLTIRDVQLNQDPTDEDLWTFETGTPNAIFYDVFDRNGTIRNHTLADLYPNLSEMGFDDNGVLSINAGEILEFGTNSEQSQTLTDGNRKFSQVVTISESGRNSGIFDTADYSDESLISVRHDAPRGHAAAISYNDDTISLLTGTESADISLGRPSLVMDVSGPLLPGTKIPIILVDEDQNLNSGIRETLDVFRSTAIIPTLHLGILLRLEVHLV